MGMLGVLVIIFGVVFLIEAKRGHYLRGGNLIEQLIGGDKYYELLLKILTIALGIILIISGVILLLR